MGVILFIKKYTAVAIAAAIAFPCAPVMANDVMIEANAARAHDRWGGELGIGYTLTAGRFALRPIVGAFIYKGDNDRYYEDTFSNGQTRCRDSQTGQFAKDSECDDTAVKAYGKIEATYSIPHFAEIGGGVRFSSDKVRPYGTVGLPLGPRFSIKGNAGPKYYALGIKAGF